MRFLIALRWVLLIAALVCGVAFFVPWAVSSAQFWGIPFADGMPAAALLQALGTLAMSRHTATRGARATWSTILGYGAVAGWLGALMAANAGVEAGSGGLVYGLLIMLPAALIGLLLQIAALIGFTRALRAS